MSLRITLLRSGNQIHNISSAKQVIQKCKVTFVLILANSSNKVHYWNWEMDAAESVCSASCHKVGLTHRGISVYRVTPSGEVWFPRAEPKVLKFVSRVLRLTHSHWHSANIQEWLKNNIILNYHNFQYQWLIHGADIIFSQFNEK